MRPLSLGLLLVSHSIHGTLRHVEILTFCDYMCGTHRPQLIFLLRVLGGCCTFQGASPRQWGAQSHLDGASFPPIPFYLFFPQRLMGPVGDRSVLSEFSAQPLNLVVLPRACSGLRNQGGRPGKA